MRIRNRLVELIVLIAFIALLFALVRPTPKPEKKPTPKPRPQPVQQSETSTGSSTTSSQASDKVSSMALGTLCLIFPPAVPAMNWAMRKRLQSESFERRPPSGGLTVDGVAVGESSEQVSRAHTRADVHYSPFSDTVLAVGGQRLERRGSELLERGDSVATVVKRLGPPYSARENVLSYGYRDCNLMVTVIRSRVAAFVLMPPAPLLKPSEPGPKRASQARR